MALELQEPTKANFLEFEEPPEKLPKKKESLLHKAEIKAYTLLMSGVTEAFATAEKLPRLRRATFELAANAACLVVSSVCRKDMRAHHPKEIPFTENPNFRSYSKLLHEGIQLFKSNHPDTPVMWSGKAFATIPNMDLVDIAKGAQLLRKGKATVDDLVYRIINAFPSEQRALLYEAKFQFKEEEVWDLWAERDYSSFRNWLLETRAELGRPITQPELIAKSLEVNGGDLNQALKFLREYYYSSTRAEGPWCRDEEAERYQKRDAEEVKDCILDQFSEFNPFNELGYDEVRYPGKMHRVWRKTIGATLKSTKGEDVPIYFDFSLNNRIGELYHATHLVEFLAHFPPEAIAIFMMGEYLNYGELHGLAKFLADLRVIADLYKVQGVINKNTTPAVKNPTSVPENDSLG